MVVRGFERGMGERGDLLEKWGCGCVSVAFSAGFVVLIGWDISSGSNFRGG